MEYFLQALDPSLNTTENDELLKAQAGGKNSDLPENQVYIETHIDAISRVLFIYAKLNTGIKYV